MREFRIGGRVGLVAAGWHIEIMQGDRAAPRAARCQRHGDVTGIPFFAKRAPVDNSQREFRGNRDPMIAFLAVDRGIWVAELMECSQGKLAVPALRLLKAENVRRLFPQKAGHEIDPQPDRIDVPGGKGETHARLRARLITLKGPPQAPPARSPQFLEWPEDGWNRSALAWPRDKAPAKPPRTTKRGRPARRPDAPGSETFTGRGPASLTQAERGGTPERLRRSH